MASAPERVVMDLPWNAGALRLARNALREWGATPEAEVVLRELVTNALDHGAPPVSLVAERRDKTFWIGVCDECRDWVHTDSDSAGLPLVEAFATSWGVTPVEHHGKCVWADVPT